MKIMLRSLAAVTLSAIAAWPAAAQMTIAQKQEDFRQLAALYDKQYAFYEWKRDAVGFDLLNIQPWLARIAQTTDDLGYYEIAGQYVGSLKDGHDMYLNPSDFVADLRFRVDIYEGKVLVDVIDTKALSPRQYDIKVGDELVSVDGKTPEEYIRDFSKYAPDGSAGSTRRDNVTFATIRIQSYNPRAAIVGDSASVVLRGSDGNLKTLTIPWVKRGTLFTSIGPVPNPYSVKPLPAMDRLEGSGIPTAHRRRPTGPVPIEPALVATTPAQAFYHRLSKRFQLMRKPVPLSFNGIGAITPVYRGGLPSSFKQRLGTRSSDSFFSGTYTSGGYTLGLIRIPDFCGFDPSCSGDPSLLDSAISQFQKEIAFMKQNTDGLVVDVARNPGGYGFYALQLLDRLTDQSYTHAGFTLRPQYGDILSINQVLDPKNGFGLEQWQTDLLTAFRDEIQGAYQSNRGMTGPLPLDFGWSFDPADVTSFSFDHPPVLDSAGKPVGYNKPVICLVDEGSFSAAELFSAAFQDAQRGPVVGMPTGGLGGGREDIATGTYSEAATSVTVERLLRSHPIANPDFVAAPFIENIGVRPDVTLDYMTLDNLTNSGKSYVSSFTSAIVALLPPKN